MARPQKNGLDYFPLDVDIDQDDKIALIEAQHGMLGFAIVVKLLMKIYKNSYFYEWTEKEQLLFSKRINIDINLINVVINDCIKWGVFDSDLLETHKILTSKGVQKRYLTAIGRRQKVEIQAKYLLLDEEDVNVYKNLVIVDNNPHSGEVNADINPQSKVKESKEKKSKEESNNNSLCLEICKYYSSLKPGENITQHLPQINIWLNDFGYEWTKDAMEICLANKNSFIKPYITSILKDWLKNGKGESHGSPRKNNEEGKGKYAGFKPPEPKQIEGDDFDMSGII